MACGYFGPDHFPGMTQEIALRVLDGSGLLKFCGVPSDIVDNVPSSKRPGKGARVQCRFHPKVVDNLYIYTDRNIDYTYFTYAHVT